MDRVERTFGQRFLVTADHDVHMMRAMQLSQILCKAHVRSRYKTQAETDSYELWDEPVTSGHEVCENLLASLRQQVENEGIQARLQETAPLRSKQPWDKQVEPASQARPPSSTLSQVCEQEPSVKQLSLI